LLILVCSLLLCAYFFLFFIFPHSNIKLALESFETSLDHFVLIRAFWRISCCESPFLSGKKMKEENFSPPKTQAYNYLYSLRETIMFVEFHKGNTHVIAHVTLTRKPSNNFTKFCVKGYVS